LAEITAFTSLAKSTPSRRRRIRRWITLRISIRVEIPQTPLSKQVPRFGGDRGGEGSSTVVDNAQPQRVVDLARAATEVREPGRALRAIVELRRRLEELEEFHVENAVRAGWSWGRVAQALAISRQAAHKRHARRLAAGFPAHRLTVTAAARAVVRRARAIAAQRGDRAVAAPHLLLALLDDARSANALAKIGVGRREIRAQLPPGGAERRRNAQISPELRRALEQSLREAVRAGATTLDPEHLLLALLRQRRGAAMRIVAAAGATAADVEHRLARRRRNVRAPA
jgi:hypothetical protein